MQLTLVDAARWQQRHWYDLVEQAQVRTASHLVLNWQERADAARLARMLADLSAIAPSASLLKPDGVVNQIHALATAAAGMLSVMRDPLARSPRVGEATAHVLHHVASFEIPLPAVVSRLALARVVRALPASVVRVKGLAVFDDDPTVAWIWHRLDDTGELFTDSIGRSDLAPIGFCIGGGDRAAEIRARFASLGGSPSASGPAECKAGRAC
jgi:G3E family GTPase